MEIRFASLKSRPKGTLVLGVVESGKLGAGAAEFDKASGGALTRAIAADSRFSGKKGELLDIPAPAGLAQERVLLVGLGDPTKLTALDLQELGGKGFKRLDGTGVKEASILVEAREDAMPGEVRACHIAFGALLASYRFDKYRTTLKPEQKPSLAKLTLHLAKAPAAKRQFADMAAVGEGVFMTRDLVSEPANIIYPASLAAEAKKLTKLGVKVQVLGEAAMRKLGMGALLGVGQGSDRESQLLVMQWQGVPARRGAKSAGKPVAFVGKGVTFDTGGISIKPAAKMEDMKWDMGGAGVVIGLMRALAARKARVNAVGVCGLVENMPSAKAQRPGDIVTSASGQTVEVINTDAEGRLVLADALWYVQKRFKPAAIVDLATLTGAIIIALGNEHAGLFSNNDELAEALTAAGKAVGEPVWRLPLGEAYDKLIDSPAADVKNVGNRSAGSITAAQFLQRFVKEGTPWAHLDIAGVTWAEKDRPTIPVGGTGFGVQLLDRLVRDRYEK